MGREDHVSPFPENCIANAREVRGWTREEGECCTAEAFRLDLNSSPGSAWNKSAITVFVDDFIEVGAYACTDRAQIRRMMNRHFRTLKRRYKAAMADIEAASRGATVDRSQGKTDAAKRQRRYNKHQKRLRIALWYPETRKHGPLVHALGPDGMSSDEEEYSGTILLHYRISSCPWRETRVTSIMRLLDALERRYRSDLGQGDLRGAKTRLRCLSEKVSKRTRGVPGLPRDAYDAAWLEGLRPLERRDLEVKEGVYDFSVPANIQM
ncbi:uncharacterized protein TRAVEDRAFT_122814 [Trametes versicolor FP-101664 SS1]|uniref:uncharacterized protein n=1 Tax=Trametes versicolor (strain FP-101664) TaxID=717944 RepID=UPI0004624623|nr:uncharacterized protein TRAVEDRAFT_122814 [Trametes versicolor FP-101664 SS1]EIW59185.1 hypothetical protein TRAVEDRAFT_122814 [Trametes versicolor FP-101664 SS1]